MYKFELHLHTNNCSACGQSSAEEMIDTAALHGYSGIVLTNHFYHGNTAIDRSLPWKDFVSAFEKEYSKAKKYGKQKDVTVFFGIEEGYAPGKEMLIYGLKPRHLAEHPEFLNMTAREKSDFVHSFGGICVCAHPFRSRSYIPDCDTPPDPDLFDGVEGFNYCNQPEENQKAFIYALNNGKFVTSGSDTHHISNFGNAGIAFYTPVKSYADFVKKLKKGEFKLITPYELR